MFFLLGIFLAIFLGFLLLIKKNKSRADIILTIWIFFICITQLLMHLTRTGYFYKYPHWLGVNFSVPVIVGLLLYFYVREITGNKLKNKAMVLLHFIPTIVLIILAIPFYILSGEEKIYVFENEGIGYEWFLVCTDTLIPLSGIVYSIWALLLINKHQIRIQDNFSNTDKKELQWLRHLSIGFIIIWVISIFFDNSIIYSAVVLLVLFIGVFGINQLNIFYTPVIEASEVNTNQKKEENKVKRKSIPPSKRYSKSGLNEEMAAKIYVKLKGIMGNEEIYKNENLTLTELANFLNVHPNHLSQVINEQEGKNFYNYINTIRINKFIKLASFPENKKYTMISLAYDCGFSSKSTFNKHFKGCTGKTPTEFFNMIRDL